MSYAGIDVGSLTAQAVIIEDGRTPMLKTIGVKLLTKSIRVKPAAKMVCVMRDGFSRRGLRR